MLRDARTIPSGETLETDVCIIGAGPAGITVALGLEQTGLRVALIESGDTEHEPSTLELTRGEVTGYPYEPLHEVRAAGFGGSTSLWQEEDALRARPLDPIDFEPRSVPHSGWPFGRDHLDPFYLRAHDLCILEPGSYEIAEADPAVPPLPLRSGRFHTTTLKFTRDMEVFRHQLDRVVNSCSVTLHTHAHAVGLKLGPEGGSIDSVDVVGLWNTAFTLKATVFVLASGGIENARLLLLSANGRSGVGNQNDLVGRYFMEHPRVSSGVLVPQDRGLTGRLGLYRRHLANGWMKIGVIAPDEGTLRSEEILNGVIYLRESNELRATDTFRSLAVLRERVQGKVSGEPLGRHLRQVLGHPQETWAAFRRRSADGGQARSVIQLVFQTEQAPNPSSRVTLAEAKDPLGFPLPRLEWRLTELDTHTIRRLQELLNVELMASRIGSVERMLGEESPPAVVKGHRHLMGTTRMHQSPRHGVVDSDCRVHGVSNLYIAGSSVFPTVGYANPTLTIVALSLRLADRLTQALREPVTAPA